MISICSLIIKISLMPTIINNLKSRIFIKKFLLSKPATAVKLHETNYIII